MKHWTEGEVAQLRSGLANKTKTKDIASAIGRTPLAVNVKMKSLGLRRGVDHQHVIGMGSQNHRRFGPSPIFAVKAKSLADDHPAILEGRTLFPKMRRSAEGGEPVLKSGQHNQKIGKTVTKGRLRGAPIYTLTLEERATCPESCKLWSSCYGNRMHWSRRFAAGTALEDKLFRELEILDRKHRATGFLVRLHVLGDFYSIDYVTKWASWLEWFPSLNVFGFTAHKKNSVLGSALLKMTSHFGLRFAVRFLGSRERKPPEPPR